jgi:hypothetical protein
MQQNEQLSQPFFAQFLESEKNEEMVGTITKPILDLEQTQKYPSDSDEV